MIPFTVSNSVFLICIYLILRCLCMEMNLTVLSLKIFIVGEI